MLAKRLDTVHRPMKIGVAFPVDKKRVGASADKFFNKKIGIRNHQVHYKGKTSHAPHRTDYWRSHRDVRDKVPIHHIDVDAVYSRTFGLSDLFAQACEVGI